MTNATRTTTPTRTPTTTTRTARTPTTETPATRTPTTETPTTRTPTTETRTAGAPTTTARTASTRTASIATARAARATATRATATRARRASARTAQSCNIAATQPGRSSRIRGDGGSSDALGLALIAPAALGLAMVILFLGRGVDSRATVQVAAESGAQAAAQERTPSAAVAAGTAAATAMLLDVSSCSGPSVFVDTTEFGPGGVVSVTVSCTVSTRGVELINPPQPGSTVATAIATIDPFRAAQSGAG